MRTLMIILCGVLLWVLCISAGKLLTGHLGLAMTRATIVFLLLWLIASAANLWLGVKGTGYSMRQEVPIFLLVFLLPAALALIVRWRMH